MNMNFEVENLRYEKLIEIISEFEYPVILLKDLDIVDYNQKAKELFCFLGDEKNLNINTISSKFEKNTFYQDFIIENIHIGNSGSKRFKWIHRSLDDNYFISEVVLISVNIMEEIYTLAIINDLSIWIRNKRLLEIQKEIDFSVLVKSDLPMLIIDSSSGNIENFNRAAIEFYGYTKEEMNKINIKDINLMDLDLIKIEMKNAKNEIRGHFIFNHKKKSGEIVEVDVFSGPINLGGKTKLYSIISPIKKLDSELSIDFDVIKKGYLNIPIPTIVLDGDMKIRELNDEFVSLFLFDKKECIGSKLSDLICPIEYLEEFKFYERMMRLGEKVNQEVKRKNKSGRILHLKAFGSMFKDLNKNSNYIICYIDNQKNYKIKERLNIIDNFFKIVEEGVMITDKNLKIIWVNEAFEQITGYYLNQIIYKKASILKSNIHGQEFYDEMSNSLLANGGWEGEIYNRKSNGELYSVWLKIFQIQDLNGEFRFFGGVLKDLTKKNSQDEKIKYYAYKDILTGLDNRIHIIDRLNDLINSIKEDEQIGMILFDLDNFKRINDSLGHAFGDRVLIEFANRLKDIFKDEAMIARVGGDEFGVVLRNTQRYELVEIVSKSMQIFSDPFIVEGHIFELSVSAGALLYPEDANKVQDLLKRLGMAVSYAKRTKGNSYMFFKKEIEDEFNEKYLIDKYILKATKNNELALVYQGIKNINTGEIDSAEVLIRWNSRELGFVSPIRFISIAEKNLSIIAIGKWVLEEVCKNIKKYESEISLNKIAINISVVQLENPDFFEDVKNIIKRHGVKHEILEFEITESVYMKNMYLITENLKKIYDYGISISMDDFGTGYSSLSQIRRLKLSKIKIDKEFIFAMQNSKIDTEIVTAIVALAKGMSLQITAEGVENQSQYDILKSIGCDYAQGYHIHKPSDIESFKDFILKNKK